MNDKHKKCYIIDFDSTFIRCETLEVLADVALEHHLEKASRFRNIASITEQAMEGRMGFEESLAARFSMLSLHRSHIQRTVEILKENITPSFLRCRDFFKQNRDHIFILSGSFIDLVWPIVEPFGIMRDHVFANRLLYDYDGNIHDYDRHCLLAQNQGKVKFIQHWQRQHTDFFSVEDRIIIGDGYNDYEIKEAGLAGSFIFLSENVRRQAVMAHADAVIDSLDGLFLMFDLPYAEPRTRSKVLLLEGIHPHAERYFNAQGYEVVSHPHALSGDELIHALHGVNILGLRSKTEVSHAVLAACPDLKAIGAFCIGTNQIDLAQASMQGIAVFNAPYSNTRSVVELALAEIIMLMRRAAKSARHLRDGQWLKSSAGAHEVRGKTLGIIGYGNIGSQLSIVAEALGMQVIFFDRDDKLPLGNARACASLDALLEQADIITVHIDGQPENRHVIDFPQFEKMKPGVIFLNLSRDFVVNSDALWHAVQSNRVAGIGIDVFPNEPQASRAAFSTPLQSIENAILTPHIGGSTEEAQQSIAEYVSKNIHAYCTEGSTLGSVNLPVISASSLIYSQRILHVHENVPGILAQINRILANASCNIEAQLLKTNDTVGYVITDLTGTITQSTLDELTAAPHTIRVSILKKNEDFI